ncbi:MAG: FAD-dependent monooxygenase [Nitratireductor sp.]|nr:FAD-dependent monooxygenase [Nitratireductor sp.]
MATDEIAICGAGVAGLALALFLSRAGKRPVIFEKFERPKPVGSGLMLQPTGLAVMEALGLGQVIRSRGSRIDTILGRDSASGRTVLDVRYAALGNSGNGLAVQRAALFDTLWRAVQDAGIEIETGVEVADIDAGEAVSLIDIGGKSHGRFDLVVDATGAHSHLLGHARYPARPRPLPFGAWWVTLPWQDEGFDRHALLQRYRRAAVMIGVLPTGDRGKGMEAAFFWSLRRDHVAAQMAQGLESWKDTVRGHWPEAQAFLDHVSDFGQLTFAAYGHHTLRVPAGRGVAFIGDAAHSTSPQLGQGANMALLDAAALAHVLGRFANTEEALQEYARLRYRHIRLFQAMSYLFTPFYQSDSVALPLIRDWLVPPAAQIPLFQRMLARMVSGTFIDPCKGWELP